MRFGRACEGFEPALHALHGHPTCIHPFRDPRGAVLELTDELGNHFKRAGHLRRAGPRFLPLGDRSEEHTSELQSLMRISYAVFCLKKKKHKTRSTTLTQLLM